MTWRPIETAPRDGTQVIGYGETAGEIHGPLLRPLLLGARRGRGQDRFRAAIRSIAVCETAGRALRAGIPHVLLARGVGADGGLAELDAGETAMLLQECRDAPQGRDLLVVPEAEIAGRDASVALDRGGFDDHRSGAAERELAQVHEMPVIGQALDSRVLAHRRNDHAVRKDELAQLERRQ